nr:putative ribonuclease H-like domain-containing protein [Tanacetum cinerariifolium]
ARGGVVFLRSKALMASVSAVTSSERPERFVLEVGHSKVGRFRYLVVPGPLSPRALFPPPREREGKEEELELHTQPSNASQHGHLLRVVPNSNPCKIPCNHLPYVLGYKVFIKLLLLVIIMKKTLSVPLDLSKDTKPYTRLRKFKIHSLGTTSGIRACTMLKPGEFELWRMRIEQNKQDLDTLSMDDLYNNLKIYESEVKGISRSTNTQNMAFVSSSSNNSNSSNGVNTTQGVNNANGVNTVRSQVNAASALNIDNLSDAVIYALLASQPNSTQLVNEDLEQIHPDDLEEMDLKPLYKGCQAPKGQDNRSRDATRKTVPVETPNSSALSKDKSNEIEPESVRKHGDAPIIRDWVSDDEEEEVEKQEVKPSINRINFVKATTDNNPRKTVKTGEKPKQNTHRKRGNQINWNGMMSHRNHVSQAAPTVNAARLFNVVHPKRTMNAVNLELSVNAAKAKAKYNAVKGKRGNVVKASACWSSQDNKFQPSNDDANRVDEDLRKEHECNDQGEEDSTNSTNSTNRVNTVTSNINAASSSGVNTVGTNISINLSLDPIMPSLEDIGIFENSHDDEDVFDSDYAWASLDRKSTTGGCQFLGCRLISWQCKKQTGVANSTTEAEYVVVVKLKKYQEKDKIESKPNKKGKHGEAEKSLKQLQ